MLKMFLLGMLTMYIITAVVSILSQELEGKINFWADEIIIIIFAWWIVFPIMFFRKIKKFFKKIVDKLNKK